MGSHAHHAELSHAPPARAAGRERRLRRRPRARRRLPGGGGRGRALDRLPGPPRRRGPHGGRRRGPRPRALRLLARAASGPPGAHLRPPPRRDPRGPRQRLGPRRGRARHRARGARAAARALARRRRSHARDRRRRARGERHRALAAARRPREQPQPAGRVAPPAERRARQRGGHRRGHRDPRVRLAARRSHSPRSRSRCSSSARPGRSCARPWRCSWRARRATSTSTGCASRSAGCRASCRSTTSTSGPSPAASSPSRATSAPTTASRRRTCSGPCSSASADGFGIAHSTVQIEPRDFEAARGDLLNRSLRRRRRKMRIAMVGGSVAGLSAALFLARDGHEVVVLERDAMPLPATPLEAFESWDRRGAPQVRHSHAFLARLRNLLRDRAPDVLAALLAAGAEELRYADLLPPTMADRAPRPGDEDLVMLACRRLTFEWVLRELALGEPRIRFRDGAEVRRRCAARAPPRACPGWTASSSVGRAAHGEPRRRTASSTRRAGARSSPRGSRRSARRGAPRGSGGLRHLLLLALLPAPRGRRAAAARDDDRRRPRLPEVRHLPRRLRDLLDHLRGLARRRAAPGAAARGALRGRLRRAARDARLGATRLAEPITGVHGMAEPAQRAALLRGGRAPPRPRRARDRRRGDPHEPALRARLQLRRALRQRCSPTCCARTATTRRPPPSPSMPPTEREIVPWYELARRPGPRRGRGRRALAPRRDARRAPARTAASSNPKSYLRALLRHGLVPALRFDADVSRAFFRSFNLLDPPGDLLRDPRVMLRVLEYYRTPPRARGSGARARAQRDARAASARGVAGASRAEERCAAATSSKPRPQPCDGAS